MRSQFSVYWLKNDYAIDYFKKHFDDVFNKLNLSPIDATQEAIPISKLIYIGHGNTKGVFSNDSQYGLQVYYCDSQLLSGIDHSPQLWWACFTARWLQSSSRKDWIGFENIIGSRTKSKKELQFWNQYLNELISKIIRFMLNEESEDYFDKISRLTQDKYNQIIKLRKKDLQNYSFNSVLFAKAFTELKWGKKIGAPL